MQTRPPVLHKGRFGRQQGMRAGSLESHLYGIPDRFFLFISGSDSFRTILPIGCLTDSRIRLLNANLVNVNLARYARRRRASQFANHSFFPWAFLGQPRIQVVVAGGWLLR